MNKDVPASSGRQVDTPGTVRGMAVEVTGASRFRFGMRSGQVVAVTLLGLSFLMADLPPLHHSDVWGHLKIGHWIVAHGRLPSREPLCAFSDREAEYVNYYW